MATAPPRKSGSNKLSNFAYVDSEGAGHLPLSKNGKLDKGHVRNALARFNQTHFESPSAKSKALAKIHGAAKSLGIKVTTVAATADAIEPVYGLFVEICAAGATPNTPPEWVELIPAGEFMLADGRGPFVNDDPAGVIAGTLDEMQARGLTGGIPFDYDHSTDFAAPEGHPSPASGWMKEFKVEAGAVWGRVDWTQRAAGAIAAKEYKYISPVFASRCTCANPKCTADNPCASGKRHVIRVLRAALTNNPAMPDIQAIAAAHRSQPMEALTLTRAQAKKVAAIVRERITQAAEGTPLSEIAKTVEEAFPDLNRAQVAQLIEFIEKLEGETEEPESVEAEPADDTPVDTAREGHAVGCEDAECQGECLGSQAAGLDESDEAMALEHARALHEGAGEPSDDEITTARNFMARHRQIEAAKRKGKEGIVPAQVTRRPAGADKRDETIMALGTKVTNLENREARRTAEAKVAAAMQLPNAKIDPAMKDWALDYAMRDPAGFDVYLQKAPPIFAASGVNLRRPPAKDPASATALDDETAAVCTTFGIKPDEYIAYVKANKDKPGSSASICAARMGL
jgi:phage I-like protein